MGFSCLAKYILGALLRTAPFRSDFSPLLSGVIVFPLRLLPPESSSSSMLPALCHFPLFTPTFFLDQTSQISLLFL